MISVGGKKYKVVENLGFVHDAGQYAKVIMTESGECVAVRRPGAKEWKFARVRFGPRTHVIGQVVKYD